MLASQVKQRLDIPGHEGQWVEIRKLGWRKLRDAADVQQREAYAHVRVLGKEGLDAVKDVTPEQIEAFKKNRGSQYDPGMLLRAAVIAWSLSDKPTPDEIDDLDPQTARWLLDAILALSDPPPDEAATKKD